MILFTPKKLIDVIQLHDVKFTAFLQQGNLDRSFFIPRYKTGSKRIKDMTYSYKKRLSKKVIERIAQALVEQEIAPNTSIVHSCFLADNFEPLVPSDLL